MIFLISPHTVIKRNYYVNNFNVDVINKLEDKKIQIYSQGINLANTLKIFQNEPFLLTFFGGVNGKHVKNHLHVNKIKYDNVHISKNTYEKINIIDEEKHTITAIKDFYVSVDAKSEMQYLNKIKENFKRLNVAILDDRIKFYLSNSGVDQIYKEAKECNVRLFQDVKDEINLGRLLELKPFAVKFNRNALKKNDVNLENIEELEKFAYSIICQGISLVLIDLDKDGAYVFSNESYGLVKSVNPIAKKIPPDTTDAFLAAFASGVFRGYELEKNLKLSYAAELAVIEHNGIENVNRKLIYDCRKQTKFSLQKYKAI